MKKKLVVIESPFAGNCKKNIEYARACMKDCFLRGEYPFASHLLYTQPGILDDNDSKERKLGIEAGFQWGDYADIIVVYTDLGTTTGMKMGIDKAKKSGKIIEHRSLDGWRRNEK